MHELARLGAPEIEESRHGGSGDSHRRRELALYLSDWHLLSFLGTSQLISEVRPGARATFLLHNITIAADSKLFDWLG